MAVLEPRPEYPGEPEKKRPFEGQPGALRLSPEQSFERERLGRAILELRDIEEVRTAALGLLDEWTRQRGSMSWVIGASQDLEPSMTQLLTAKKIADSLRQQQSIEVLRTAALDLLKLAFQQRAGIRWAMRAQTAKAAEGFSAAEAARELRDEESR